MQLTSQKSKKFRDEGNFLDDPDFFLFNMLFTTKNGVKYGVPRGEMSTNKCLGGSQWHRAQYTSRMDTEPLGALGMDLGCAYDAVNIRVNVHTAHFTRTPWFLTRASVGVGR